MARALQIGKLCVYGFTCIFLLTCTLFVLQGREVLTSQEKGLTSVISGANTALETVNRPCGTPGHIQPCGTLAEVDLALVHARNIETSTDILISNANKASSMEVAMLPEWNRQFTTTFSDLDATAKATTGTAIQATDSLKQITGSIVPVLNDTDTTVKHADGLVTSPDVAQSLFYWNQTSASVADTMKHVDATAGDVQFEADKLAHPPKKKLGFWGAILAGGDAVRHFMPPLF
jgi:hypothetical protein